MLVQQLCGAGAADPDADEELAFGVAPATALNTAPCLQAMADREPAPIEGSILGL